MQHQTLPDTTTAPAEPERYTVTIPGAFAWADRQLVIPAPHTADEIARVIHAELTEVGYADLDVTVDLAAGMARIVWQGGPLDAPITGPGVAAPAEPERPDLTAAVALLRDLYAAGWLFDSTVPMVDGREHTLLHPAGPQITARTRPGSTVDLTLTGLTLDQAVAAVRAAGLAPAAAPAELTVRERLAAELHRIAADLLREDLPLPDGYMRADLHLGILDSRADLDGWADYLGSPVKVNPANSIPSTKRAIKLGTRATLHVGLQADPDPRSEVEQLRARVAELEAQQTTGGTR
ncbi:hypothetical protein [Micromonospora okii]|uniref:hypothetical protein n=1 Tax=Micromonospora okii TaxID=1182970 RepID=UPI001E2E78EC|nr:hypothetical protein [Micromonospora okii]